MTKHFHHGYLLVGDTESAKDEAENMAVDLLLVDKKHLRSHPDFFEFKEDKFAIEDARDVRKASFKKSFLGKGRVFFIETNYFTPGASNALLKTLEEPAGLSYFFIITSSVENILVTLRSRLAILKFLQKKDLNEKERSFVEKFLKTTPNKRFELIKKIVEKKEKEKIFKLLNSLEFVLAEKLRKNMDSKEFVLGLSRIISQRQCLSIPGASLKMILENLCFVLPKI